MAKTQLGYCTAETNVISSLADRPNEQSGMTAEQLKAKFDAADAAIKGYINGTLVPYINETLAAVDTKLGEHDAAFEEDDEEIAVLGSASHTHENKALLDSYTVSNGTIEGTVEKAHTHDNMDALSSFTKTMKELMEEIYANAKLDAHPVGSVYISEVDTSPDELFGGTWERIKDTFLLAAGDTYAAGGTGGEATHTLTVDEMPSHNHQMANEQLYLSSSGWVLNSSGSTWARGKPYTANSGGGKAHNNMPPYKVYYMWVRTA